MLHVSSREDTTAVSCNSFTAPGVLVLDTDSLTQHDQNRVFRFCFQTEEPSSPHQNQNHMSRDVQYQPAGSDLHKLQNKNVSEAADEEEENLRNRYQPWSCYSSDCLKGEIEFQALSCWPQTI